MKIFKTVQETQEYVKKLKKRGNSIGFVPTMGSLHEGHLSLVKRADAECDKVIVSIFVNPIQFGPNEDFDKYPRDYQRDIKLLRDTKKADCLFVPERGELLPEGFATEVNVDNNMQNVLCGPLRPGHFKGVTTIVAKLLNITQPDKIYLGQKDYQQAVILTKMARDLNYACDVVIYATVREADGLAMSSRNAYLSENERAAAPALYKALQMAESMIELGEKDNGRILSEMKRKLREAGMAAEYVEMLNSKDLAPANRTAESVVLAAAVKLGKTRLIDNVVVPLNRQKET